VVMIQRNGTSSLRLKARRQLLRCRLYRTGKPLSSVVELWRLRHIVEGVRLHDVVVIVRTAEACRRECSLQTEACEATLFSPVHRATASEAVEDLDATFVRAKPCS